MRLYKNSVNGAVSVFMPGRVDLSELTEGTDFVIDYHNDSTGTKTIQIHMTSADGLDAVDISNATPFCDDALAWQYDADSDTCFVNFAAPVLLPAGTPEPDDFSLYKAIRYYTKTESVINGSNVVQYNLMGTASWNIAQDHYIIEEPVTLWYQQNGNCFGVGRQYFTQYITGSYYLIVYTSFGQYNPDNVYNPSVSYSDWHAKTRDFSGDDLMQGTIWGSTGWLYRPSGNFRAVVPSLPTSRNNVYMVGFMYDDVEYIGIAYVEYSIGGVVNKVYFWGAESSWWSDKQGRENYTVNPDGSVNKAVNPHYVKPTDRWTQSTLPADGTNRIVTGANYIHKIGGIPYGYATYILTNGDFQTCIAEWSNALAGYVSANSSWYGRLKGGIAEGIKGLATAMLSDPIESILKVHTLPIPSNSIRRAAIPAITYVRSGGLDSTVSAAGVMAHNDGRIVELTGQTDYISRLTGNFADWTGTNCSIYLPCFGEYPIKSEWVIDHTIYVDYRFDILTGNAIAVVRNEWENIMTVSGNMSMQVTCSSSASIQERALHSIGSAISSAVSIAAAGSTGNALGTASAVASGVGQMTNSLARHVTYSQVGGTGGLFSGLYDPVVLIRRQIPSTGDLSGLAGYPSGSICRVSDLQSENGDKAFVSVQEIDINIPGISDAEAEALERIMKGGVYL